MNDLQNIQRKLFSLCNKNIVVKGDGLVFTGFFSHMFNVERQACIKTGKLKHILGE